MKHDWVPFYEELAEKLLPYKSDRKALVDKIKQLYADINMPLPKLESDDIIRDIDPFTIFGMFNKGLTEVNRKKVIEGLKKAFGIQAPVPTTFDGIPHVNPINATFYTFLPERGENDIDDLWALFMAALNYASDGSDYEELHKSFDACVKRKWNGTGKITMGLFWIAPETFLNLDKTNTSFIYDSGAFPEEIVSVLPKVKAKISANDYFKILAVVKDYVSNSGKWDSLIDMSEAAWKYNSGSSANQAAEGGVRYWLYSPGEGAEIWDDCQQSGTMAVGWGWVGPLDGFASVDEIKKHMNERGSSDAPYKWPGLALWQFAKEMKPGDVIFAKTGRTELLGRGVVEGEYFYDGNREEYRHIRKVKWTVIGSWKYSRKFITKTLTDISPYPDMVEELNNLIDGVELPQDYEDKNYWLLKANPNIWSFSGAPIGEKRRIYQSARDVKPDDTVFGYDSSPVNQIVALAKITEQDGERLYFEKTEDLTAPIDFQILKNDPELSQMRFFTNPEGSLFKLTKNEAECLMKLVREKSTEKEMRSLSERRPIPPYTPDDFLSNVYMSRESYNTLRGVLKRKKNVLLEGAPGVGKTFAAKRFAWSVMGEKDNERIEMVQFHQSYTYEDFIMGFRPTETGFDISTGVFYDFCTKAEKDPDRPYFFIIDEINRGNLSKIFGELFMLVENENRGKKLRLLYRNEMFAVPENLYIIGMMNTADRSLAMIDYALRRRFSFFPMKPAFDSDGFKAYQSTLESQKFNKLIDCVVALNNKIADDEALGEGFCIGHSYFCNLTEITDSLLSEIVEYEIIPLIREYWFDEPTNVRDWSELLRQAIK